MSMQNKNLKIGISGLMRVKNDAELIEASIDSCIDALDELIIVYNDCTDDTPVLIEKKQRQYPDKIKVYEYKYKVYGSNLSKEEYEYALNLPEDSPHLLCNYYNYTLSKANYSYAMKIDADQIYFTERLKELCDLCRFTHKGKKGLYYWIGFCFHYYFLLYRFVCIKLKKKFPLLPSWLICLFTSSYIKYAQYRFSMKNGCLSLSGINVFNDGVKWYVPLGKKDNLINILPPYNGENDHLIFKVSSETYYKCVDMPYYNILTSAKYSLIEEFIHPYKPMFMGFAWFHLNSMRESCRLKVLEVKNKYPDRFVEVEKFVSLNFNEVERRTDKAINTLYQRLLFAFIHTAYKSFIKKNLTFLDKIHFKNGYGK